ncbi:MAG: glycosyltransferase [Thermacetogeniaceae bacterium]
MKRISLCMIVKNEEKNLRRCLESVRGAVDEIIVVDTGSTDGTCGVAAEFGAVIRRVSWNDDFSQARNASLELATGDWIFFLDADEELAPGSGEALRRVTAEDGAEGYFVKVINYLGDEGWVETCPDLIFRLFRNRKEYRFRGAIHEQIVDVILEKNRSARYLIAEDIVILHYGYMNRAIAEKDKKNRNLAILQREVEADPDNRLLRYHYGVELYRSGRYREAAEELVKAASGIDPRTIYLPKLLRYLVLSYHAAGMRGEAMDVVRLCLRLYPDYADIYYYGGLISYEEGNYSDAWDLLQQALSMPEQPLYYASFSGVRGFRTCYLLGKIAETFCNEEEAVRYYIKALRDKPAFLPALESIVRLLRPWEDPEYARECLDKLCEFGDAQAYFLMSRILFRQSAFKLALEYLERGMCLNEPPPELQLWRGICLAQQGRYLEALRAFDSIERGHPLFPVARLNKALCFWFQGNRRRVQVYVDELLQLGLSRDTCAVLGILKESLRKRGKPQTVVLGEEGMALFLEILGRTLDLKEKERALSLLRCLAPECLAANTFAVGELFLRYGYTEVAREYISIYLNGHPDCAAAWFALAEIEHRLGNDLEAEGLYRRALALDPSQPRYYLGLMKLYQEMRCRLESSVLQNLVEGVAGEG